MKEETLMMDTTEIQRDIQEYYEKLYTTKVNNLEEMKKSLEIYNLSRLNNEELQNLNRLFNSKEIETIIRNLSKSNSPGPDGFTSEFC